MQKYSLKKRKLSLLINPMNGKPSKTKHDNSAHNWEGSGQDCPQCQLENMAQQVEGLQCDKCHKSISPLEVTTTNGDELWCEACMDALEARAEAMREDDN
jgi:hypothetical protein